MQGLFPRIVFRVAISVVIAIVSGAAFLFTLNFGPCGLSGGEQGAGGGAPAGMMAIAITVAAAIGLVSVVILVEIAKSAAIIKADVSPKFWAILFLATVVFSIAFASWFLYIACDRGSQTAAVSRPTVRDAFSPSGTPIFLPV